MLDAAQDKQTSAPASTLEIAVRGMTCAACVRRVEKAIGAVDGVVDASVNLATERAHVSVAAGTSGESVADAIRRAGYEPVLSAIDLRIDGMTCASCVGRVEKALRSVPGVLEANVNLATERATVRIIGGEAIVPDLLAAVKQVGYGADVVGGGAGEAERDRLRRADDLALLRRSFLTAAIATAPLVVLEMGTHLSPGLHHLLATTIGQPVMQLISVLCATIVQFGPGREFYSRGFPALRRSSPDMNSLVMLGTSAAYGFSMVSTLWPQLLPGGGETYFESAAVVITLILLGRYFEVRAKGRTGDAIRRLMTLEAKTAQVLRDGQEVEIRINDVRVGDLVVVKPGAKVPVDGAIVEGSSFVDQSMMTGEPIPAQKGPGDSVVGGTINKTGAFVFRATKVGADMLLAEIVRTVEAAQGSKLPIQARVDQITAWFVPAVLAIAVLTFSGWLAFGPAPALSHALVNAVAVLIVACPCAMGLATPVSIMVATGKAAELGILFRRGDALQALHDATVIAFDKTGTLTEGRPRLTDFVVAPGYSESETLAHVAAAEQRSEHPIASAVIAAARQRGLTISECQSFAAEPGYGVTARVGDKSVAVGGERMMRRAGLDPATFADHAARLTGEGKTALYAAIDGRLAAIIAVADQLKPTSAPAIAALRRQGLRIVMITGDDRRTAAAIARRLGIDEVQAEVLPTAKAEAVKALQAEAAGRVAFVGDGINDAPALAQADVGIAIGNGTDVAIESADAVLMAGTIRSLPGAIALSHAAINNVKQNLFWAFAYNVVLIPVAAGLLYPHFGIQLSPVFAGLAMALSSVTVVTNALRLRTFVSPAMADAEQSNDPRALPAPAE